MRKALTFALTMAVALVVMPLTLLAQTQATTGSVAGRSVDAVGRGVSGERVELMRGTELVTSVTTNGLGDWAFPRVEPGVYTVKMNVRGRVAGVRVTVAAGQTIAGTMIVVPAASASLQLGAFANLLTLVPAGVATTASTVAATVQVVETTELNPTNLVAVLNALQPAERQAFAQAVVAAVQNNATNSAPFEQYVTQFQQIAANPTVTVTVTSFPAPQPISK